MKDARQKANDILDKSPVDDLESDQYALLAEMIYLGLKMQDRDTRHACANAVISLHGCHTSNDNSIYNSDEDVVLKAICVDKAHSACMNAKAV